MKKALSIFLATFILGSLLDAAPARPTTTKKAPTRNTASFTKGSIVDGTTNTGSVRRWFFFNEGSVGGSYNWLGRSAYVSVDLGYTAYLRSIESVLGGMNFMIGTEISAPIFIRPTAGSRSNILNDHRYLERNEFDGVPGGGLQLPVMMGFEYRGFYFVGLAGYTWLWMNDTYPSTVAGPHPTIRNTYDGVVYGGGIGYKVTNLVNIGIRYMGGFLTNRLDQLQPDASLANQTISHTTGRNVYDIPYHRLGIFVSLIY